MRCLPLFKLKIHGLPYLNHMAVGIIETEYLLAPFLFLYRMDDPAAAVADAFEGLFDIVGFKIYKQVSPSLLRPAKLGILAEYGFSEALGVMYGETVPKDNQCAEILSYSQSQPIGIEPF
jgi:hypothetical protein